MDVIFCQIKIILIRKKKLKKNYNTNMQHNFYYFNVFILFFNTSAVQVVF